MREKEVQSITHTTAFAVVVSVATGPAVVALVLRIWIRACWTKNFSVDDVFLLLAQILNCANLVVWLDFNNLKTSTLSEAEFRVVSVQVWFCLVSFVICTVLVKIAVALFFARATTRRWQKWFIWTPLAFCVCFLTGGYLAIVFRCGARVDPVRILTSTTGCALSSTVGIRSMLFISSIVNACCDCAFAIVPIYILIVVRQAKKANRNMTMAMSALAIIGAASSIIRIPWFSHVSWGRNFIHEGGVAYLLCVLETEIGILTISVATLKPLLNVILQKHGHFWNSERVTDRPTDTEAAINTAAPGASDWGYAVKETPVRKILGKVRLGVLPSLLSSGGTRLGTRGDTIVTLMAASRNRDCEQDGATDAKRPVPQKIPSYGRTRRITATITIDEVLHGAKVETTDSCE